VGFLLNEKIKDNKALGLKHEVEYNLELAALAGADTSDKDLTLDINSKDIEDVSALFPFLKEGRICLALHPFTSDPAKQWPMEKFVGLAGRLTAELDATVCMVGTESEGCNVRRSFASLGSRFAT